MLCVEDKVRYDLAELVGIGAEHRQIGGEVGRHFDAGRADTIPDEFERSADDLVQVDWLFLWTALARHRKKALDDAAATLCRSADPGSATGLLPAAILLEQQCLTDDDRQRVIELVCHPGQERSEGAHLFALVEPVTLASDLLCGLLLLRQISNMGGKKCAAGDLGRGNRQLSRELFFTTQRRDLDPPVEDTALPGAEVMRHAGVMRRAQPLWDDDVADLRPDRTLARYAEHSLGSGVELENDPLIVGGDDAVEGTLENPAKAPLTVAQRRYRPVVCDRDTNQPGHRVQRFEVERTPAALDTAIVKADATPPFAPRDNRDAQIGFDAEHLHPMALVLGKLADWPVNHLTARPPCPDFLEGCVLYRDPGEACIAHDAANARRIPLEEIVLQIGAVRGDRVLPEPDTAHTHHRS